MAEHSGGHAASLTTKSAFGSTRQQVSALRRHGEAIGQETLQGPISLRRVRPQHHNLIRLERAVVCAQFTHDEPTNLPI